MMHIDNYCNTNSSFNKLDPRIKIISFFGFIVFINLTPPTSFITFLFYFTLIIFLIILSQIPLSFIFKRSLVVIPFVLIISIFLPFMNQGKIIYKYSLWFLELNITDRGVLVFFSVLIKSYLSVLCMVLLISSINFSTFLKALEKLRFPKLIVIILSFMYRYIFVLYDELIRMKIAKESRSVCSSKWFNIKVLSNMIGVLFIRSLERAEFVYLAMCSRGFNGKINTIYEFKLTKKDLGFLLLMFIYLFGARLIEMIIRTSDF